MRHEFNSDQSVDKIFFDGGICSGKTTGIEMVKARLIERGIIPLVVPEMATIVKASGLHPKDFEDVDYQILIFKLQAQYEDQYMVLARKLQAKYNKRVVMICDRAKLSGSAYMNSDNQQVDFQKKVLGPLGLSLEQIRSEYKGGVFLTTAADGAEEYFTYENNNQRDESKELARILNTRSFQAWFGVEEFRSVKNRDENHNPILFDDKMQIATQYVFDMLGEPFPIQNERRFLLKSFDEVRMSGPFEKVTITQSYLVTTGNTEEWVREREWMGTRSYSWAEKTPYPGGGRVKILRTISESEYHDMVTARKDVHHITIMKDRYCFSWNGHYYKVDVFRNLSIPPILEMHGSIPVPEFLDIRHEVTGDRAYHNFELSKM
jgi:thymidylate kinase/CYTH domain-containing protein